MFEQKDRVGVDDERVADRDQRGREREAGFVPSTIPDEPVVPAMVVTTPVACDLRIVSLFASAM